MFDLKMGMRSGTAEGPNVGPKIISGIHGLHLKLNAIVDTELRRVIYQAFEDIVANFPNKTGATIKNLKFEELGNGHYRVVAYPNVDPETGEAFNVIMAIEYGTRAHGPVTAKALRFIAPDKTMKYTRSRTIDNVKWDMSTEVDWEGGEVVYTSWVRGIPAHYIIKFAIQRMKKELKQLPQRAVAQV